MHTCMHFRFWLVEWHVLLDTNFIHKGRHSTRVKSLKLFVRNIIWAAWRYAPEFVATSAYSWLLNMHMYGISRVTCYSWQWVSVPCIVHALACMHDLNTAILYAKFISLPASERSLICGTSSCNKMPPGTRLVHAWAKVGVCTVMSGQIMSVWCTVTENVNPTLIVPSDPLTLWSIGTIAGITSVFYSMKWSFFLTISSVLTKYIISRYCRYQDMKHCKFSKR